jgi:hypothetical protein
MNRALERKSKQVTETSPCMVVGCKLYSSTSFKLFYNLLEATYHIAIFPSLELVFFHAELFPANAGKDHSTGKDADLRLNSQKNRKNI